MAGRTVNPRIYPATVTTVAGTTQAAPLVTTVNLGGEVTLRRVDVTIPPGNSGLAGWGLQVAGTRILPFGGASDWVIADDAIVAFPMDFDVSGRLQVVTFNTDIFSHSFYFRFEAWDLAPASPIVSVNVQPIG